MVFAAVRSLITGSLTETQQLRTVTEKTAVCAAHKFRIRKYSNRQPFFFPASDFNKAVLHSLSSEPVVSTSALTRWVVSMITSLLRFQRAPGTAAAVVASWKTKVAVSRCMSRKCGRTRERLLPSVARKRQEKFKTSRLLLLDNCIVNTNVPPASARMCKENAKSTCLFHWQNYLCVKFPIREILLSCFSLKV